MTVKGKVALVTGGGSGIGKAACLRAARDGMKVAVADISAEAAAAVAKEISDAGGEAVAITVDVTSEDQVADMVAQAVARFGRIDAAFNSAGAPGPYKPLLDLDFGDWKRTVDINLHGTFLCVKTQVAAMVASGGGTIVNMASAGVLMPSYPQPDYHAAKAGIIALTRNVAVAYAKNGIRTNVLLPGPVETPMLIAGLADIGSSTEDASSYVPRGKIGTAEEIAGTVAWLFSDDSGFVNGAEIVLDGGLNLC